MIGYWQRQFMSVAPNVLELHESGTGRRSSATALTLSATW